MSLNSTNFVNLGPIRSADMRQFVDLFTGVMNDQPVTFKNAAMIGGSQGSSTSPLKVYGSVGQTSNLVELFPTAGSPTPTFGFGALGALSWGAGSPSVLDTFLSRIAMQNGHVTDTAGLLIEPYLEVKGTIKSDGFTFANSATLIGPAASPFMLQVTNNLAVDGWAQQTEIATPATPPAGQVKIYPKTNRHLYILDSSGTESDLLGVGNVVVTEEFLPANAATQVTVTQIPSSTISVARNGVVQSTVDGHYSRAGQVYTFTTPFDGNDRVVISYATGGVLGIAPPGTVTGDMLADKTVTNAKLASDTARANLLTNGGFEIWQRGTGPFIANGNFTADRWIINIAGTDTMNVNRNTAADSGSVYAAGVGFTLGTGAFSSDLRQVIKISDHPGIRGRAITFSARVITNVPNSVRLGIFADGTGGTAYVSPPCAGTSNYETLTRTYANIPYDATQVILYVAFGASGSHGIDNAMLVVGGVPADYAPLHPADDLARCQRYYEVDNHINGQTLGLIGGAGTTSLSGFKFPFKVTKAVTPTMTNVGGFNIQIGNGSASAISPITWSPTPEHAIMSGNQTVTNGTSYGLHASGNTKVYSEANP